MGEGGRATQDVKTEFTRVSFLIVNEQVLPCETLRVRWARFY